MDLVCAVPDPPLSALAYRYAAAVDHRDADAFASVFRPEATLSVHRPGRPAMVLQGHDQLRAVVEHIAVYASTRHIVAQTLHEVRDDTATGEVYCVAHHFTPTADGNADDLVMQVTYRDRYERVDGRWSIAERSVHAESEHTVSVSYRQVAR